MPKILVSLVLETKLIKLIINVTKSNWIKIKKPFEIFQLHIEDVHIIY